MLHASMQMPLSGTAPMKAGRGTETSQERHGPNVALTPVSASNAASHTKPEQCPARDSALTRANLRGDAHPGPTTNLGGAHGVVPSSPSTDTTQPCAVRVHVRVLGVRPCGRADTYDLTIDAVHEFLAGGIIVHNSMDESRYLAFSERDSLGFISKPRGM